MQPSQGERPGAKQPVNVRHGERIASIAVGFGLRSLGLLRWSRVDWSLAATGATLPYRGLPGYCAAVHAFGIDPATDKQ